jgi:Putative serine dehydratase domain
MTNRDGASPAAAQQGDRRRRTQGLTPEFGDPTVLAPGATWFDFSEEDGEITLQGQAQGLRIGDKIELIPRHGCTTVNLYDRYHVVEDGRLTDMWRVAARGRGDGGIPCAYVADGPGPRKMHLCDHSEQREWRVGRLEDASQRHAASRLDPSVRPCRRARRG